ncbi:DUF6491 family protein [Novosphingobium sp. BL-8A]|uniref:DUF6491 family protein n=1 Tax=Novosphingobium sp. BL-8A TaxID=3127639 RepID=UPI0037575531
MTKVTVSAVMVAFLTMTGCAADEHDTASAVRQPRQCFWANDVRNFRAVNSTTVNVRAGRDVYRLDLMGICPDINWSERLGLVTTGTSSICSGAGLGTSIVTRRSGGRGQQRCPVRAITVLTPEEVAAMPSRERP